GFRQRIIDWNNARARRGVMQAWTCLQDTGTGTLAPPMSKERGSDLPFIGARGFWTSPHQNAHGKGDTGSWDSPGQSANRLLRASGTCLPSSVDGPLAGVVPVARFGVAGRSAR